MKRIRPRRWGPGVVAGLAALLLCLAPAKPAPEPAVPVSIEGFAEKLVGHYERGEGGRAVSLDIEKVGRFETERALELSIRIAGCEPGENRPPRQAVLRLEEQKEKILVAWVATNDPRAGYKPGGQSESAASPQPGCRTELSPAEEAFTGLIAAAACETEFPGARGNWTVRIAQDSIELANRSTGKTLVFRRKG